MSVNFSISRRKAVSAAIIAVAALWLAGCSKQASSNKLHSMGEEIATGQLVYLVTQTTWSDQLDGQNGLRVPANKFLLVNVTVKNAGRETAGVPLLTLVDANGKEYMELDNGDGVTQWLGALRTLADGATESGNLLFDVPQGSYTLRLSSGGDVEKESTALVNLPYNVEPGKSASPESLPAPANK